jgi:hypothetical protein
LTVADPSSTKSPWYAFSGLCHFGDDDPVTASTNCNCIKAAEDTAKVKTETRTCPKLT